MPKKIKDDPRVEELAKCVVFAINSFKNAPVIDSGTNQMTTWHVWFKKALEGAGYVVTEPEPTGPPFKAPINSQCRECQNTGCVGVWPHRSRCPKGCPVRCDICGNASCEDPNGKH